MSIEERWNYHYERLFSFLQKHKRRPSKYNPEERDMFNWYKHNKRQLLRKIMLPHRWDLFVDLMNLMEKYQRVNQYSYKNDVPQQLKLNI